MSLLYRFTSIGRTLDPRNPTNALIMAMALAGGAAAGLLALGAGIDIGTAVLAGLNTGGATFLAWVFTREIDPDHPYAAHVSGAAALVASLALEAPPLAWLALIAAILAVRMINRIVGPPFHWIDTLAAFGLALLLAVTGDPLAGLMLGVAFALDGLIHPPLRRHLPFAALAAAAAIFTIAQSPLSVPGLHEGTANVIFVIVLAFGLLLITLQKVDSRADVPEYPLHVGRVQAAMVWLMALALLNGFTRGEAALPAYLPIWAALAGAALYRVVTIALEWLRARQKPA